MKRLFLAVILIAMQSYAIQPAQVTSPSTPPPPFKFSSSLVASVQLTGTAEWTYGSDHQTGTVTFAASSNGQSQMTLQLDKGSWLETQNAFTDTTRQCTWTGFDGTSHSAANHLCWVSTVWFLPQITMQPTLSAPGEVKSLALIDGGATVREHHEFHPASAGKSDTAQLLAHLSAVDLDYDILSALPSSLRFVTHPDSDAGTDIPTEIRFGAYQTFNAVSVPTHIQKLVNGSVVLDLHITAVQVQFAQ